MKPLTPQTVFVPTDFDEKLTVWEKGGSHQYVKKELLYCFSKDELANLFEHLAVGIIIGAEGKSVEVGRELALKYIKELLP